jgi:branched-chain amino acid transport system substrate-binding protein
MIQKITFFLLAILITLSVACSKKDKVNYIPVNANEIRIGALVSLSGDGSSTGQSTGIALDLARLDILEYFAALGRKETVTIEIADTKTDSAEALKQLKIFYEKGIRLIIGPYSSTELLAVKDFADTHGMLIVSPSSTAVSFAIPDDNIFRFVSGDVIQGEAMNKMLTDDKVKVIVPFIRDDLWGNDLLASTRKNFIKSGGEVLSPVKYTPGATDFSGLLNDLNVAVGLELGQHNPNEVAVYMLSFAEGSSIMAAAKNYSHLNNVYWYGGSAFAENPSVLGDTNAALFAYTHGLPCPIYGLDDAAKDKWQPLRARIMALIGRAPDVYALTAYDALWVGVLACSAAGYDPGISLLKTAFTKVAENFSGVTGSTRLDENGDRAIGNYDFWAVKSDTNDTSGYTWKRIAKYNSVTGTLVRVNE